MTSGRAQAAGALLCAIGVAAGALGAHLLRARLDAGALARWETAVRYLLVAGFGALAAGLAAGQRGDTAPESWLLVGGGAAFAIAVGGLALAGPLWLGAVAPFGGLSLIAGFLWLAMRATRPSAGSAH